MKTLTKLRLRITSWVLLPLAITFLLSLLFYLKNRHWVEFFRMWFGLCVGAGMLLAWSLPRARKDLGRKLCNTLIAPVFLLGLGLSAGQNYQLDEVVFSLDYWFRTGLLTDVLVFYLVMKLLFPLLIGRACCGWGCWTSALLDWLPVGNNRPMPGNLAVWRLVMLALSLGLPAAAMANGWDTSAGHFGLLSSQTAKSWFVWSNLTYYALGIGAAFWLGKQRAFCKIFCPVGLIMSWPSRLAWLKKKPTGIACTGCQSCNRLCPMDVEPMQYIQAGKPIATAECIHCFQCQSICPVKAIR